MPTWPGGLPAKPLDGTWSESPPDEILRSPMDIGPAKVRRRVTAATEPVAFDMHITEAQRTTLRSFIDATIGGGALAFDWAHPVTGTTESFRLTSMPSLRSKMTLASGENLFLVSFKMEILP